MILPRPTRTLAATAAVALAALICGCGSPAPAPAPTPTGFASEAEAFAAAEETYRAYVDALNRVDLSDPATFEDVYQWTTGDLNASDREGLSRYHAEGFTVSGESVITTIEGNVWSPSSGEVSLAVCLDVSSIALVNASGDSQVQPDRTSVQSLTVALKPTQSGELAIRDIVGREGAPECDL
ncbi:hypothetical protein [Microbacterium sp. 18062]|uniref:hypothetical protein n=1 Tax=Microbacterium sp. 18062 TaxID=2681410 RepID=UPI00135AFF62|nr:hypothetical protein [Microbacterium sp. 18062]